MGSRSLLWRPLKGPSSAAAGRPMGSGRWWDERQTGWRPQKSCRSNRPWNGRYGPPHECRQSASALCIRSAVVECPLEDNRGNSNTPVLARPGRCYKVFGRRSPAICRSLGPRPSALGPRPSAHCPGAVRRCLVASGRCACPMGWVDIVGLAAMKSSIWMLMCRRSRRKIQTSSRCGAIPLVEPKRD